MKTLFKSMVIAGAVVMAAACGGSGNKAQDSKAQDSKAAVDVTPTVSVEQVTRRDVPQEVVYSTTVQAFVKNNIAPQSVNRIATVKVEVGDTVKAGDVLAMMDRTQLVQAEIQKSQAEIQMGQTSIQLAQAELQMKNNEAEYNRLKVLYDAGGLSVSDLEAMQLAYDASKLTYENAQLTYNTSKQAYKAAETQYKNLSENSELKSPISGIVTARNYDAGDMYAMSAPVFVVEQISPVKLLVAVSESDYSKVEVADSVKITADALPGKTFDGVVNRVYPTVDPVTRTVTMEVKVENADQKLRPGMFARAKIVLSVNNSIIVPDVAVIKQQGSGEHFVYTLNNDNTVSYTKVKLGRRLGETCEYEILEGLEDGDKVVTGGMIRLKDGIKVIVNE